MTKKRSNSTSKKSLKTKQKIDINSNSNNVDEWDSVGQLILLSNLDKKLKGATSNISQIATNSVAKKILSILKRNKLVK